jgi:hypothetical protein
MTMLRATVHTVRATAGRATVVNQGDIVLSDDGKLHVEPAGDTYLEKIASTKMLIDGKEYADPASPEHFIRNLCRVYHGSHMWVDRAVETPDVKPTVLSHDELNYSQSNLHLNTAEHLRPEDLAKMVEGINGHVSTPEELREAQ